MPLFGSSQESKNRKQFELAAKRISLAPEKLRWAAGRGRDSVVAKWKSEEWEAWWSGGISASNQAVNTVPSIKQAWDKGSEKEALSLAQLFTLPMVPRFFRRRAQSLDERLELTESGLRAVTHLFENPLLKPPPDLLAEYMKLAVQFEHSEDHREQTGKGRGGFLEARYLMSRALTACGQPSEFELLDVRFPVDTESEFVDGGGKRGQLNDNEVFALDAMVNRAANAMVHTGNLR